MISGCNVTLSDALVGFAIGFVVLVLSQVTHIKQVGFRGLLLNGLNFRESTPKVIGVFGIVIVLGAAILGLSLISGTIPACPNLLHVTVEHPSTNLTIPVNSESGITYTIQQSGTYTFQYVEGTYTTQDTSPSFTGAGGYRTDILVFRGLGPIWNGSDLDRSQALEFNQGPLDDLKAAIDAAKAKPGRAEYLKENDVITIIVPDKKGQYRDNNPVEPLIYNVSLKPD